MFLRVHECVCKCVCARSSSEFMCSRISVYRGVRVCGCVEGCMPGHMIARVCVCARARTFGGWYTDSIEHLVPPARAQPRRVSRLTETTNTLCQGQLCWRSLTQCPKACPSCLYAVCITINITLVGLVTACLSLKGRYNTILKHLSPTYVYHI